MTPGARTDSVGVSGGSGSNTVIDPSIIAPDAGRPISGAGIPANACVGPVTDAGPRFDTVSSASATKPATNPANKAYVGSFQVVDCTTGQRRHADRRRHERARRRGDHRDRPAVLVDDRDAGRR